ncbi:Solute carrier family 35 member G1 [Acipenser ruthenus]|uniref:Solute carrier family 35 member G1 n=1 Tax=Acipenser ruthenus TaxID=7906 RepID=A0A444UIG7_ACIRT|nr:solute carrier family 35 member G1 [Acipenser ruthenus]RXM34986.1 Solute carrier family 35 member G1 [Acipenser ruthenus]
MNNFTGRSRNDDDNDISVALDREEIEINCLEQEDERETEKIELKNNSNSHHFTNDDGAGSTDNNTARMGNAGVRKQLSVFMCCGQNKVKADTKNGKQTISKDLEKKPAFTGIGLVYALLASFLFSVVALLAKKIEGVHSVEISLIRCFFQMVFVLPAIIYNKTGFLGPRDQRIFLFLRGFLGANAMILLFYAVQQMPLADATVIMFSNPVFTAILAWIFLKEKCTIWDFVFTIFTLTGVILIARPPFLFGSRTEGIEGEYTNHMKGTIAAFAGAVGAACTFVVLRKMGKSVHYYLSVWYYAVIGFIECVIALFAIQEWSLPYCGGDRWLLILIGLLGVAGQAFLTKALQLEKAGPVALMRTMDVVFAFIFQFFFLNRAPTWWSFGGAFCVISSTSGIALRKWYINTRSG